MPRATATPSPQAATPAAFARAILCAYERRGMDPGGALAAAQIRPALLQQADGRITAAQLERLSAHAMRELDDEGLGWFSRRLPWGSYGMLARASMGAPDLGTALRRWCRHHGLIAGDIRLQLHSHAGVAEVLLHDPRPADALREFCHVTVMRNLHGLACWFIDSRIPLLGANFSYARPAHASAYAVLFPGPLAFDTPDTALRFDARYLSQPLRRDEAALGQMLQHALTLIVQSYRRDRLLLERARQCLLTQADQAHSAVDLARLLHVSPRTLHRHLQEQGRSLQALKDEVRRERAMELLQRTQQPIKRVAEASGYRNEKSFIRAFKGWTGQSPAAFRRLNPTQ